MSADKRIPKSPDATCFIALDNLTTGRSRMILITIETVTPMITLKNSSHTISGISNTRLKIILDSQDSKPDSNSVPMISAIDTRMNSTRMFSSLFALCARFPWFFIA